ncbi:energy transducer TonB [Flavobacterium sp. GCM10023249]|uniref:energy transducer TonB n=1 Tax=unclassified Flavobacterium TaxID=196869 RepID=UPI003613CDBF
MKNYLVLMGLLFFCLSFGQKKTNPPTATELIINKEEKNYNPDINGDSSKKNSLELEDSTVYSITAIEIKPEFKGGSKNFYNVFNKSFKLSSSLENDVKGKIIVEFIIEKNGEPSNIRLVRDLPYPGISIEAIRVLKTMGKWQAGIQNGKRVRTSYLLPIEIDIKANTDYNSYVPQKQPQTFDTTK